MISKDEEPRWKEDDKKLNLKKREASGSNYLDLSIDTLKVWLCDHKVKSNKKWKWEFINWLNYGVVNLKGNYLLLF